LGQLSSEKLVEKITWGRERLETGTAYNTQLVIGSIGKDNPRALIVAGIHGDEQPWASMAINKMLTQTRVSDLLGSLTILPMANPTATEADSRVSTLDHLDLNRSFPGDPRGSHTERLAAKISTIVDSGFDLVIDLHGGGSWCVNAFSHKFRGSDKFAEAFNAPFIVDAVDRDNTLTGYSLSRGAKVVAVEMGGRCSEEDSWAEKIATGAEKALKSIGVLDGNREAEECKSTPVGKTSVLRPSRGGIFKPRVGSKKVGTMITEGEELGYIVDPSSFERVETFAAPYAQTALLLLRPALARVEQGAMSYVVAPLYK
jgi:predicted deacylase